MKMLGSWHVTSLVLFHSDTKGGISLLSVRVLSNNHVKAAHEIDSLHQKAVCFLRCNLSCKYELPKCSALLYSQGMTQLGCVLTLAGS